MKDLKKENNELKKALNVCLNKPLVKKLTKAMERIEKGEYMTEEEFFKNSPQPSS